MLTQSVENEHSQLKMNGAQIEDDLFSIAAVLNLFRLTDHLVNLDWVCGPPLKIVILVHCG